MNAPETDEVAELRAENARLRCDKARTAYEQNERLMRYAVIGFGVIVLLLLAASIASDWGLSMEEREQKALLHRERDDSYRWR